MSLRTDLTTRLLADTTSATVSNQVRNEGDSLPGITLHVVSADHQHHSLAATGKVIARIQVDCHASTPLAAETLAEEVRQSLDGLRGTMGSTFVSTCHLDSERTAEDPPVAGNNESGGVYTVQQDYLIGWTVSVPTFA